MSGKPKDKAVDVGPALKTTTSVSKFVLEMMLRELGAQNRIVPDPKYVPPGTRPARYRLKDAVAFARQLAGPIFADWFLQCTTKNGYQPAKSVVALLAHYAVDSNDPRLADQRHCVTPWSASMSLEHAAAEALAMYLWALYASLMEAPEAYTNLLRGTIVGAHAIKPITSVEEIVAAARQLDARLHETPLHLIRDAFRLYSVHTTAPTGQPAQLIAVAALLVDPSAAYGFKVADIFHPVSANLTAIWPALAEFIRTAERLYQPDRAPEPYRGPSHHVLTEPWRRLHRYRLGSLGQTFAFPAEIDVAFVEGAAEAIADALGKIAIRPFRGSRN